MLYCSYLFPWWADANPALGPKAMEIEHCQKLKGKDSLAGLSFDELMVTKPLIHITAVQSDTEDGAFTQFALHRNSAVHALEHMLDDGESETGTPHRPGTGLIDPVKALEDAG
jgi:hypothetical protein